MHCTVTEQYGCDLEHLTFEQLVEERKRLLPIILSYENNPIEENGQDPSPETIYQVAHESFSKIWEHLRERYLDAYIQACHATFHRDELRGVIDRALKNIWVTKIVSDYSEDCLLKEDALKCAYYHHLRSKLESLLVEHHLRIYPEYYIASLNYRVDIAIVKINDEDDSGYLKDAVTDILALIELKYTGGSAEAVIASIKHDITKMKQYRAYGIPAQCYCAIIYEDELKGSGWTDKRTTNRWANGNLTLLMADMREDTMWFEVSSYNGMNVDIVE